MDPKHLAIAHGEKAVVVLIAAFCGWTAYSAFTDPGIRPEGQGVTQQSIGAEIDLINNRMGSKDAPNLKSPKPYMQAMADRFTGSIPRPQRYSWLFAHPDIDGSVSAGPYFYVYEVYQPKVTAADDIGKVILTLTPPDGRILTEDVPLEPGAAQPTITSLRHTAALDFSTSRSTERGEVVNQAHVLGIQVDMAVGQDGWHPLRIDGQIDNGFVPAASLSHSGSIYKFKSTATWQEVRFRTRTVVKATGFTGADPHADETVLMHLGYWPEPKDWKQLDAEVKTDPAGFMKSFMQPDDANLPSGVTLAKGEHLYYSEWNEPEAARTIITDEVRFAFIRFEGDKANPAAGTAHFWVSRQYPGGKWLARPQEFRVKIGKDVGGKVDNIHTPLDPNDMTRQVDLTTPFRLVDIKSDVMRTLFWGIRAISKPDQNGTHSHRELDLRAVVRPVEIAVLENTKTSNQVQIARLEMIDRPDVRQYPAYYPILPKKKTDEQKAFELNPAGYQELPMEAEKPQQFDPNDPNGPLAKLHNSNESCAGQATTAVPYYQFADGRLVWLNEENFQRHGIFQYPEPKIPNEGPVASGPRATPAPATHPRDTPRAAPPTSSQPGPGNTEGHGPPPPTGAGSDFHGPPPGVGPQGGMNGGGGGSGGGQTPPGGNSGGYGH